MINRPHLDLKLILNHSINVVKIALIMLCKIKFFIQYHEGFNFDTCNLSHEFYDQYRTVPNLSPYNCAKSSHSKWL